MKQPQKGEYEWLSARKRWEVIKTAAYFSLTAAIFITGWISTKTTANLLTIVAVLGCLPAGKSCVSMIMFLRITGCSHGLYSRIREAYGETFGYYHLYFTSYEKNYEIHHLYLKGGTVAAYSENQKIDPHAAGSHLLAMLRQAGISDVTVKVFTNEAEYLARLKEMTSLKPAGGKDERIRESLFNVSL